MITQNSNTVLTMEVMNGTLKKAGSSGRGLTGSEAVLLAGLMSVLWNKEKHTGVGIATQGLLTAFHIGGETKRKQSSKPTHEIQQN